MGRRGKQQFEIPFVPFWPWPLNLFLALFDGLVVNLLSWEMNT